jgi:hypothetical protein
MRNMLADLGITNESVPGIVPQDRPELEDAALARRDKSIRKDNIGWEQDERPLSEEAQKAALGRINDESAIAYILETGVKWTAGGRGYNNGAGTPPPPPDDSGMPVATASSAIMGRLPETQKNAHATRVLSEFAEEVRRRAAGLGVTEEVRESLERVSSSVPAAAFGSSTGLFRPPSGIPR